MSKSDINPYLNALSFEMQVSDLDTLQAFANVYQQGQPSFYFQSEDEGSSAVTLMGFNPAQILKIADGKFSVQDVIQKKEKKFSGPPLEELKNYLNQLE
ncbi:MAG: hypothetical protein ACOYOK_03770, partial [Pseudobdellovibrionaceae bacterium]